MKVECLNFGCRNQAISGHTQCYSCAMDTIRKSMHVAREYNDTKINGKDEDGKLPVLECMRDGFGIAINKALDFHNHSDNYMDDDIRHIIEELNNPRSLLHPFCGIAYKCLRLVRLDLTDLYDFDQYQSTNVSVLFCAIKELVKVWQFGLRDHVQGSWKSLTTDQLKGALYRHFLERASCLHDKDSGLLHSAHMAWNALAIVWIESQEKDG